MARDGTAVLDASGGGRVAKTAAGDARRAAATPALRRDPAAELAEDFAGSFAGNDDFDARRRMVPRGYHGVRFRFKGGVPRSIAGRVIAGLALVAALAGVTATLWAARTMLLRDPRLVIASSSAIQIVGNQHVTRPQLLSVFGEDVDRNLLTVPLEARREELEQLPWVEHATVMRLLPDRLRVAIVERTPVAFVRQGSRIGLVDAHGVLLDMESDPPGAHYSFPVVTGLSADDPLSVRAARMKLYLDFMQQIDAGPDKVSKDLSEVDLSDPEDVKALVPSAGADILVHFGQKDFLHRYQVYAAHVAEWKSANPRLASVDMRYEHQVVLEMAKPAASEAAPPAEARPEARPEAKTPKIAPKSASKPLVKAANKPVAATSFSPLGGHLQTPFDVHPKPSTPQAVPPR
jgi:cell division protein FtsQ